MGKNQKKMAKYLKVEEVTFKGKEYNIICDLIYEIIPEDQKETSPDQKETIPGGKEVKVVFNDLKNL